MPHITVPLSRTSPNSDSIKISYTLRGHGPILVVLVPGLCVPSSMYDAIAAFLVATTEVTTIAIDNRGIGSSDIPHSSLFGGPGYTVSELAHDAWDVVDHVIYSRDSTLAPFRSHIALIGHSMGGMIVQTMLTLRPQQIRYVALLATHAGGLWNLLPTLRLLRSAFCVALSGFDRDVHAAVNLSLHFTQRFLDDCIGADDYIFTTHTGSNAHPKLLVSSSHETPSKSFVNTPGTLRHRRQSADSTSSSETLMTQPDSRSPTTLYQGINFVESKVIEFARDAQIYFGLPVSSLPEMARHPQQSLLDAIARRAERRTARRRRWDIYHAQYTGLDAENESHSYDSESAKLMKTSTSDNSAQRTPCSSSNSSDSSSKLSALQPSQPSPTLSTYYGHVAVVRSHFLPYRFALALRRCTAIVKLVVIGRHDSVVAPSSSRALANTIDANTVVELDAAHFVTDEAAAEVTTQILYGLRKAFFAPSARVCTCEWCDPQDVTDLRYNSNAWAFTGCSLC